jgi:hypothetical protein
MSAFRTNLFANLSFESVSLSIHTVVTGGDPRLHDSLAGDQLLDNPQRNVRFSRFLSLCSFFGEYMSVQEDGELRVTIIVVSCLTLSLTQ